MIVEEKWQEILLTVKEEYELSNVVFDSWIKPLEIFQINGNKIYILAPPEQIALNYITKKYRTPLKVVIAEVTGVDYEIEFILPEDAKKMKPAKSTAMQEDNASYKNHDLNPNYTFDTFVVGSNNKLAHTISLVVAEEAETPAKQYNPLFLWGGVGLGKTHLMHSIAHHILANHPKLKIQYVPSEVFTNEVIDAIRNGSNSQINAIRDKYRNVDVLLIDDIQFIIGKDRTQEEFFNTFNVLYNAGKQIVVSSDKPPKEMTTLEERFRSRFQWGCMADIGSPDYETRMAILQKKAQLDGLIIDNDILSNIATKIDTNIRELEGALTRIVAYAALTNQTVSIQLAETALKDIFNENSSTQITANLIQQIVANYYNIHVEDIQGSKKTKTIAFPRQIAMYLCRKYLDISLPKIGEQFGGRDHTTVIYAVSKIEKSLKKDALLQQEISELEEQIKDY